MGLNILLFLYVTSLYIFKVFKFTVTGSNFWSYAVEEGWRIFKEQIQSTRIDILYPDILSKLGLFAFK